MAKTDLDSDEEQRRDMLNLAVKRLLRASEKPGIKIDWSFIESLEGNTLDGTVPDVGKSESGVTVAAGFDIGQRNVDDLRRLGISDELVRKLSPYCRRTGPMAKEYLSLHQLKIDPSEARAINRAVRRDATETLISRYNADSTVSFEELPAEAQTVIASVEFQYGSIRLKRRAFWNIVTAQQWGIAVEKLLNFGDRYRSRRRKEANFLEALVQDLSGSTGAIAAEK